MHMPLDHEQCYDPATEMYRPSWWRRRLAQGYRVDPLRFVRFWWGVWLGVALMGAVWWATHLSGIALWSWEIGGR